MATTSGRRVVIPMTNKSGGSVAAGDVVVIDTANDTAFTTTTTGRAEVSLGVAQETIANNATGKVLTAGYAALINVPASVTRGHYIETHTVAKQATGNSTRRSGSFGQFFTGGTSPTGWLWGQTDQTASGSAPDCDETYLTSAVTIVNADTWYAGPTLTTPPSGTYLVIARLVFTSSFAGNTSHSMGIGNGGTPTIASAQGYVYAANTVLTLTAMGVFTVNGSQDIIGYGLSSRGSSVSSILDDTTSGVITDKASSIVAVKITAI